MKLSENSVSFEVAKMILSLGGGIFVTTRYGVSVSLWGELEGVVLNFLRMQHLEGGTEFYFWVITDLKYN
jgi:hypothetical protein